MLVFRFVQWRLYFLNSPVFSSYPSRGFPGIRVEEHIDPHDCLVIVFAFTADITYPGRKVLNGDQFFPQPGEIGHITA